MSVLPGHYNSNLPVGAPVAQGWQCPFCKTVYAPSMPMCTCQTQRSTVTAGSTAPIREEEWLPPRASEFDDEAKRRLK